MKQKTAYLTIIFLLFLLSSISIVNAQDENWTETLMLHEKSMLPTNPRIVADNEIIHVVWSDWFTEYNCYLVYLKSLDNGETWSEERILTLEEENVAMDPEIIIVNDTIHLIWKDWRDGNPEIYYKKSLDNGETWTNDTRLTFDNPREGNIFEYKITGDKDTIFIVWKDHKTGSSEIYIKRSYDNGDTWLKTERITYDLTPSYDPALTVTEDNLYLLIEEGGLDSDIVFMKNAGRDGEWSKKTYLTDEGNSVSPQIAVYKKNIYVIWQDELDGNAELYFIKSNDDGETWSDIVRLTEDSSTSIVPQLLCHKDNLYLIWRDDKNGKFDVYFRKSTDGGETWTNDTILSKNSITVTDAYISSQGENLYAVWRNYYAGEGAEIFFIKNNNEKPYITLLESSEDITAPGYIDIYVKGFDNNYSNSEMNCLINYELSDGNSTEDTIDAEYVSEEDYFKARIYFNDTSKIGQYKISATLRNPLGYEDSKVIYININKEVNNGQDTPGFELFLLVFSVLFIALLSKNRKKLSK